MELPTRGRCPLSWTDDGQKQEKVQVGPLAPRVGEDLEAAVAERFSERNEVSSYDS